MRVVIVVPSFAIGGTERVTASVVQGLDERFAVTVAAPRRIGSYVAGNRDAPVREINVFEPGMRASADGDGWEPSTARRAAGGAAAVERAARAAQAVLRQAVWRAARRAADRDLGGLPPQDVVHVVNGGYPGSTVARAWAASARAAIGAAVVLSVHGEAQPRRGLPGVDRRIDGLVGAGVDAFVVPAAALGRALVARRGFPSERVVVIPNGVPDRAPVALEPAARAAARARLGVPDEAAVVACVSRLDRGKGLEGLIDAFAVLATRDAGAHLVLAGDGPAAADLRARVSGRGMAERVTFTGFLSPPDDAYAAADLVVLLSEAEGLPLVLLEAMMWRRPVVATPVGAVPELVRDGENGVLLRRGAPTADAAAAIGGLLADRDRARRMGEAGRASYEARYSERALVGAHAALYDRVVRDRASASS